MWFDVCECVCELMPVLVFRIDQNRLAFNEDFDTCIRRWRRVIISFYRRATTTTTTSSPTIDQRAQSTYHRKSVLYFPTAKSWYHIKSNLTSNTYSDGFGSVQLFKWAEPLLDKLYFLMCLYVLFFLVRFSNNKQVDAIACVCVQFKCFHQLRMCECDLVFFFGETFYKFNMHE